jgi:aryl-alcohol dehydrogenase-like predicted oxidoreductase
VHDSDRFLGADRVRVGAVGFGCWRLTGSDLAANHALVEAAVGTGMNLIDTADVYGLDWGGAGFGANERALGAVFAAAPGLREQVVLVTKGGVVPGTPYDSRPAHLRAACEASLQRLGTDHVDVYLVHRADLFVHPSAVAEALAGLVEHGLARAVGVSNHAPSRTRAVTAYLPPEVPLAADEFECSAAVLEPLFDGTLDACTERGTLPVAWSALAGGRLVGGKGDSTLRHELFATLDAIAADHDVSRAVVAIAFVLALPARPVALVGSQRPERLVELASARELALDHAELYRIVEASLGTRMP